MKTAQGPIHAGRFGVCPEAMKHDSRRLMDKRPVVWAMPYYSSRTSCSVHEWASRREATSSLAHELYTVYGGLDAIGVGAACGRHADKIAYQPDLAGDQAAAWLRQRVDYLSSTAVFADSSQRRSEVRDTDMSLWRPCRSYGRRATLL